MLETYILHEIRAFLSYAKNPYPLYFWSSHDGVEVDIFFEGPNGFVGCEIKSASGWDNKFNKGLARLKDEIGKSKIRTIGVYQGERRLKINDLTVYPVIDFCKCLWNGELFL